MQFLGKLWLTKALHVNYSYMSSRSLTSQEDIEEFAQVQAEVGGDKEGRR
jgi:hypothetical protein